jgi:hypothetical protein
VLKVDATLTRAGDNAWLSAATHVCQNPSQGLKQQNYVYGHLLAVYQELVRELCMSVPIPTHPPCGFCQDTQHGLSITCKHNLIKPLLQRGWRRGEAGIGCWK